LAISAAPPTVLAKKAVTGSTPPTRIRMREATRPAPSDSAVASATQPSRPTICASTSTVKYRPSAAPTSSWPA